MALLSASIGHGVPPFSETCVTLLPAFVNVNVAANGTRPSSAVAVMRKGDGLPLLLTVRVCVAVWPANVVITTFSVLGFALPLHPALPK